MTVIAFLVTKHGWHDSEFPRSFSLLQCGGAVYLEGCCCCITDINRHRRGHCTFCMVENLIVFAHFSVQSFADSFWMLRCLRTSACRAFSGSSAAVRCSLSGVVTGCYHEPMLLQLLGKSPFHLTYVSVHPLTATAGHLSTSLHHRAGLQRLRESRGGDIQV